MSTQQLEDGGVLCGVDDVHRIAREFVKDLRAPLSAAVAANDKTLVALIEKFAPAYNYVHNVAFIRPARSIRVRRVYFFRDPEMPDGLVEVNLPSAFEKP